MSYRQALAFGWAINWRVLWWSTLLALPVLLVYLIVFRSPPVISSVTGWTIFVLMSLWSLFVALPVSISAAVLETYSDFRISVAGPPHDEDGLSYLESLQVSLRSYAIHGGSIWLFRLLHLPRFYEELTLVLFVVLFVYPAIAAIAVHISFLGFRMFIVSNAPKEA